MTEETFERVARTYGDMLYRVAYHALKNRADAEDVTRPSCSSSTSRETALRARSTGSTGCCGWR